MNHAEAAELIELIRATHELNAKHLQRLERVLSNGHVPRVVEAVNARGEVIGRTRPRRAAPAAAEPEPASAEDWDTVSVVDIVAKVLAEDAGGATPEEALQTAPAGYQIRFPLDAVRRARRNAKGKAKLRSARQAVGAVGNALGKYGARKLYTLSAAKGCIIAERLP